VKTTSLVLQSRCRFTYVAVSLRGPIGRRDPTRSSFLCKLGRPPDLQDGLLYCGSRRRLPIGITDAERVDSSWATCCRSSITAFSSHPSLLVASRAAASRPTQTLIDPPRLLLILRLGAPVALTPRCRTARGPIAQNSPERDRLLIADTRHDRWWSTGLTHTETPTQLTADSRGSLAIRSASLRYRGPDRRHGLRIK